MKKPKLTADLQIAGLPSLHAPTWPAVFKCHGQSATPIETVITLAANARSHDGTRGLDGIDFFPVHPDFTLYTEEDALRVCHLIRDNGLALGTIVCPHWPFLQGGSALTEKGRPKFLERVRWTVEIVKMLQREGLQASQDSMIRLDTGEDNSAVLGSDPTAVLKFGAETLRQAIEIANGDGIPVVFELEKAWMGLQDVPSGADFLEQVGDNAFVQLDYSHILTQAVLGGIDGANKLIEGEATPANVFEAAKKAFRLLAGRVRDIHIAQSCLQLVSLEAHGETGKHALAFAKGGLVDYAQYMSALWPLLPVKPRRLCWDGCGWDTEAVESQDNWNDIVEALVRSQNAIADL